MKELLEKIKSINYKSKKHIVHYAVIFALIVTGTATGLMIRAFAENSVNSNSIVEDKHNPTSDKETSDETSKEENSKEENSNSSDNNSSNSTSQSNSSAETNTANSTNNNTTSKPSKPSSNNNSTSNNNKPSNNTNTSNNNTNNNKPTQPEQPKPHTHTWVHYKEQGHNEKVLVKDSWTELVPKYETQIFTVCSTCGWVVASPDKPYNSTETRNHMYEHMKNGQAGGHHDETRQVQVGVDKIEHPAEYQDKWVVDIPAYDQCSGCGERK